MNLNPHDGADVIGAVARDMTLEEPSGAFRARVLAQLPESRTPVGLRLVFPLGSAAVLMLAWMLLGPSASPSVSPPASHATSLALIRPPDLNGPHDAGPAEPPTRTVRRVGSPAAMSAEDLAWHSRAIAPLPAFAPIELPAIQPTALSITPISMDPIVTDPPSPKAADAPNGGR